MAISETIKTKIQEIIMALGDTSIECMVDTGSSISIQLRTLKMAPDLSNEHDHDIEEYFSDRIESLFEKSELTLNHTITGGEKGYWEIIIKS